MPDKTLDFLVTAVDNFGDTGFALDLAESVLFERPDWNVRFFSDDRGLFDRLSAGRPNPRMAYFELSEYESFEPSASVVSFFDRKLPEAHFAKFPKSKKIVQLSYLRFDPDVGSMNGTRYRIGNDEVVHLVPSPLSGGAGIVVGRSGSDTDPGIPLPGVRNFSEPHGASLLLQKISKPGTGTPETETVVSAFYYPATLPRLTLIREAGSKIRFAEFGNPNAEIPLPFARFDEYAAMLGNFSANVVRGENSAVKAMLAGKPFLWDFYKESNGAHVEKIMDFLEFVRPFFPSDGSFEKYASATRSFNSGDF
ncbi:MAG: elongation factor P maturation arginine rhamnosyltransferase EarP [Patescibacteria group bacterium]